MVNELLGVDLTALVTLGLVIATIILATVTYLLVREGKRQVNMLIKQTMILRSQNDPILLIKSLSFDLNKLKITLENVGNGPASSIAIGTKFFPAKQTFFSDSGGKTPLSALELKDAANQEKNASMFYDLGEDKLKDNGKEVYPTALACVLINEKNNTLILPPHEIQSYSINPSYGFGDKKGNLTFYPPYESFVNTLKKNGVTCFVLSFDLLGKNMAEDLVVSQGITAFVVDLKKHSCIQEAYRENITPHFITIDMIDLAKREIPVSRDFYLYSKSSENFPPYYEKGKPEGF